jgi:hypothetical protein
MYSAADLFPVLFFLFSLLNLSIWVWKATGSNQKLTRYYSALPITPTQLIMMLGNPVVHSYGPWSYCTCLWSGGLKLDSTKANHVLWLLNCLWPLIPPIVEGYHVYLPVVEAIAVWFAFFKCC